MALFFTLASAVMSVAVVATVTLLASGRGVALARVTLPIAIIVLVGQMAFELWSVPAFVLLASVIVSAGALAVRGRGRDHAPTWIALAVFATAGVAGGFGLLANGLCTAGDSYNCAGTGPDVLAIVGWVTAFGAYGYLAWGALRG
jgi:hypothetical protein